MSLSSYVLAFVMAGGRGSRLEILTRDRCKPAVNIFGHYRIFDFVATNIADSGIPVTLVATQFEPSSLSRHIGDGKIWGFDEIDKKFEIVHPHERGSKFVTFEGTADSVRKSAWRIERHNPDIILILGGDHVYIMNYRDCIEFHKSRDADITIMVNAVPQDIIDDLGIVRIDETGRIVEFAEKPEDESLIQNFRLTPGMKDRLGIYEPELNFLASMGNYVFYWDRLKEFLNFPGTDFGKDIIPAMNESRRTMYAYIFHGYWRDVGKIKDYFNCSMEFTSKNPPIDLFKNRVRRHGRHLPGAWLDDNVSAHEVILSSGGAIGRGSIITSCVLGHQVIIEEECKLDHCILLGADRNEFYGDQMRKEYSTRIGKGSSMSHVILDKNIWIGDNVNISPVNASPEERENVLRSIGLKPYRQLSNGTSEGDFCIEPETGILVMGKQFEADHKKPLLPNGLRC